PRHPVEAGSNTAADGIFPLTRRPGVGEMGDVTITAPVSRRGEPRIIEGYRTQPSTLSMPQGRMPVDRSVPRTEPAAATGSQPVREYRPEPRVESPPPSRVPDRAPAPAPAPAPVVHERPSAPPPPPPRAETPSKPPPSRK
ncbi:MAG TPA: hypothetical protein VJV97_00230, partial [Gemmatimonadaceae bacterium]|nr:hypothetical protein [Gemmatimonadaceae bacterium]